MKRYIFLSILLLFFAFPALAEYDLQDPNADPALDLKAEVKDIIEYETYLNSKRDLEVKYNYITKDVPIKENEILEKRTENSETYQISPGLYKTKFYAGINYKKIDNVWKQLETATTTQDAWTKQLKVSRIEQMKNWLLPVAKADSYISISEGDGELYNDSVAWSTRREAITSVDGSNYTYCELGVSNGVLYRCFFPFNTSSLEDNAEIISGSVFIFSRALGAPNGTPTIGLIQTTQTDPQDLVSNDFDNLTLNSPPEGADRITPNGTAEYKEFVLNETGLSWIVDDGYTKMGLREGTKDINNVDPGASTHYIVMEATDYAGTDHDPYLSIEWEEASEVPPVVPNGTSTIMNIESIYYIATTTAISSTTSLTIAEYKIPFLIYLLVLMTLSFTILVFYLMRSILIVKK